MRTYPDPWATRGKWTGSSHANPIQRSHQEAINLRDAPDAEALRAEIARLRRGIEAIRDFAKDWGFEGIYDACEDLLREGKA